MVTRTCAPSPDIPVHFCFTCSSLNLRPRRSDDAHVQYFAPSVMRIYESVVHDSSRAKVHAVARGYKAPSGHQPRGRGGSIHAFHQVLNKTTTQATVMCDQKGEQSSGARHAFAKVARRCAHHFWPALSPLFSPFVLTSGPRLCATPNSLPAFSQGFSFLGLLLPPRYPVVLRRVHMCQIVSLPFAGSPMFWFFFAPRACQNASYEYFANVFVPCLVSVCRVLGMCVMDR